MKASICFFLLPSLLVLPPEDTTAFSAVKLHVRSSPPLTVVQSATDDSNSGRSHGNDNNIISSQSELSRRSLFEQTSSAFIVGSSLLATAIARPSVASAASAAMQDTLDIDAFIKTGQDLGGNMGVSSQAGKSRPQTGVVFRDGSEVSQDKAGDVLAELLVGTKANPKAVLVSFASPWPLATGPVFDVECRDSGTGASSFLAVTRSTEGKSIDQLPSSFFLERLFDPTGRFSFYGSPTDIKVKSSKIDGDNRIMEISFSNLSQSTNAEIQRKALLVATIPKGTDNAVMLIGSATTPRWKKGGEEVVRKTAESFRAVAAPPSNLKLRPKDRGYGFIDA